MTALALHTALSIALVAWGYMIASRVPYRPGLVWAGVVPLVLLGYLSLVARSVFDGSPAKVQGIVGNVSATLLALAGIWCLVLLAAVSRLATRPVAAGGPARADASAWAPRDEEPVILPEGVEDWDSGSVIDAGTWPPGLHGEHEPSPGRYMYPAPEKPDEPLVVAPPAMATPPVVPSTVAAPAPAIAPPPFVPPVATAPALAAPSRFAPSPASESPTSAPADVPSRFAPPSVPVSPAPTRAMAPSAVPTDAPPVSAPARAMTASPIEPAATGVYTPIASPPVAASERPQASSADDDPWEQQIAPRRALPPSDDDF